MAKLYIYNFNSEIYETYEPFDLTYRTRRNEAIANGEPISRQVVDGNKITNEYYNNGVWLKE